MIALAILGIGLLFIAAALPVGVEYAKQGVDAATGDAAAEAAFAQLKLSVRTSRELLARTSSAGAGGQLILGRADVLARPRLPGGTPDAPPYPTPSLLPLIPENQLQPSGGPSPWEPIIKVRPFALSNVRVSSRGEWVDDAEDLVGVYLTSWSGIGVAVTDYRELDFGTGSQWSLAFNSGTAQSPAFPNAFFPSLARFYPAVTSDIRLDPRDYFAAGSQSNGAFGGNAPPFPNDQCGLYRNRPVRWPGAAANSLADGGETIKAIERRIAWTAFYRRVSYAVGSDPLLYEFIVVVTRRPSAGHRFAVQDPSSPFDAPLAFPAAADRAAPVPWLVTMTGFPPGLNSPADYFIPGSPAAPWSELVPSLTFNLRPITTLEFTCRRAVGRLLAPGSLLIPARNDHAPSGIGGRARQCTFVPSSPDALPIFEVQAVSEGPGNADATVTVKYNGAYPVLNSGVTPDKFPFWVVPPSFAERATTGQPVYDRKTPIVTVSRRIVRVPEMIE